MAELGKETLETVKQNDEENSMFLMSFFGKFVFRKEFIFQLCRRR